MKAFHRPRRRLLADDGVQAERAGGRDHAEDAQSQGDFVADQLRAAPQAAEEAELVVARPAAQHDAVDGDAAQGEDVDDADVQARRHEQRDRLPHAPTGRQDLGRQDAAEGNHGEDGDGGDEHHHGGEEVEGLVDVRRRELRLEKELHPVGQRLPQAEQADLGQGDSHAIRPDAVLHPGGQPSLDQHQIGRRSHQRGDDQGDLQQGFDEDGEHEGKGLGIGGEDKSPSPFGRGLG